MLQVPSWSCHSSPIPLHSPSLFSLSNIFPSQFTTPRIFPSTHHPPKDKDRSLKSYSWVQFMAGSWFMFQLWLFKSYSGVQLLTLTPCDLMSITQQLCTSSLLSYNIKDLIFLNTTYVKWLVTFGIILCGSNTVHTFSGKETEQFKVSWPRSNHYVENSWFYFSLAPKLLLAV